MIRRNFTNNCKYLWSCVYILTIIKRIFRAILPKAEARVKCQMIPCSSGAKTVIAKFRSKELEDVDGYHTIEVKSSPEGDKENNCHL